MGGNSSSGLAPAADGSGAVWRGDLVLEGGGFCGARTRPLGLDLSAYDGLALRVASPGGRGQTFKLNVKTVRRDAVAALGGGAWAAVLAGRRDCVFCAARRFCSAVAFPWALLPPLLCSLPTAPASPQTVTHTSSSSSPACPRHHHHHYYPPPPPYTHHHHHHPLYTHAHTHRPTRRTSPRRRTRRPSTPPMTATSRPSTFRGTPSCRSSARSPTRRASR